MRRVNFFFVLGTVVTTAVALGACSGDNGFTFDDEGGADAPGGSSGGPGGSSSGGSGSGSGSSSGSSSGTASCGTCTTDQQCQNMCAASAGALYCCDTSTTPGLCYRSTGNTCTLVSNDGGGVPRDGGGTGTDATMSSNCTGSASCAGQVCCLRNGQATCQRSCNGSTQVCASNNDCVAPQVCGTPNGAGLRTCQNPIQDSATPFDAPRDSPRESTTTDAPTGSDAPVDAPPDTTGVTDAPAESSSPTDAGSDADAAPADTGIGDAPADGG